MGPKNHCDTPQGQAKDNTPALDDGATRDDLLEDLPLLLNSPNILKTVWLSKDFWF